MRSSSALQLGTLPSDPGLPKRFASACIQPNHGVVVVEPPLFLPSSIEEGTRARRIFNDQVVTKPSFGSAGHAGNAYPRVRMLGRLTRGVHLLLIRTTWNAFGKQLIYDLENALWHDMTTTQVRVLRPRNLRLLPRGLPLSPGTGR